MPQTQANVQALFKETYRDIVPALFEKVELFGGRIRARADVEKAGPRTLRLPKKIRPGGQFRTFSQDGGDLGRGNGPIYDVATLTPLPMLTAVEINKSVRWNTANTTIAVANATKDMVADAMNEFRIQIDKSLQGAGNGVIGQVTSGGGTNTWTLGTPWYHKWLRVNNRVKCYASDLTTERTGGTALPTILTINPVAGTCTVDGTPTSHANTDYILVEGLTGATPTWIYGLAYHHNAATTGTWMALDRANFPEIRTPNVVASGALATVHLRNLKNLVEMFRGPEVWDSGDWAWYGHPAQRQALEELGIQMSLYDKTGGRDGFDPLFDVQKLRIDGMKVLSSSNADATRFDLVDFKNWGRGETLPVGLYSVDDDTIFPIYGSSGGLAAAEIFYIATVAQWFVDDPGRAGYISSLTKPTNYL